MDACLICGGDRCAQDACIKEPLIARTIAILAHYGQVTKSDQLDYILHPMAVAKALPRDLEAAGWLHDVLEDSKFTVAHLLAAGISFRTIKIVQIVSRREDETYAEFINRIAASNNSEAIQVKLADLRHNLRPGCPASLADRYTLAVPILEEAFAKTTRIT